MQIEAILWDQDDDPRGNVRHMAKHGVTKEEVEQVFENVVGTDVSRATGRDVAFGFTAAGRYLMVAYEWIEPGTAYPITAYDVPLKKER